MNYYKKCEFNCGSTELDKHTCQCFNDAEQEKEQIRSALNEKGFYNPYDVFCHPPEFYKSDKDGYSYKIHIIRWNTKSTRMSVLYVRFNLGRWIVKRASGLKRTPHGEKMR